MSKLVFNRDGGKTDEFGHLIGLMRFMQGEVIEGLQVAANGSPNMTVNVPYGTAAIPVGSGATGYRYFVGLDATENIAIPTANGSNPRNDLIVMYVDKAVTPSQSFTNNSNNMLKIMVVSGAPASTPADPSGAAIQAAVGAANPYIVLARVLTGTGVTQINSGNITDLRSLTSVGRLLSDMVATATIQNLAVTTAKLAALAVTDAKINDVSAVKLYNPVKFSVYRNAAFTGSNSTALPMDTKIFDTSNSYNTTTGVFTVPTSGFYMFNCGITQATGTISYFWASIYKNGVEWRRGNRMSYNPTNGLAVTANALMQLTAGDTISFGFACSGSIVLEPGRPQTYGEGFLVSTT